MFSLVTFFPGDKEDREETTNPVLTAEYQMESGLVWKLSILFVSQIIASKPTKVTD